MSLKLSLSPKRTNRRAGPRTHFGKFYRSTVRPKLAKRRKNDFLKRADTAVAAVARWRDRIAIGEFDASQLSKLKGHLKAAVVSSGFSQGVLWYAKFIIRHRYPYRFLVGVHWPEVNRLFAGQPVGHLGRYYVDQCERDKSEFPKPAMRREYRLAQRHFHEWHGGQIKLEAIDEALLDRFETAVNDRVGAAAYAQGMRRKIANVVNLWDSGRIEKRSASAPPLKADEGTVQYFAEHDFIPTCSTRMATYTRIVMRRLYQYQDNKSLPWAEFTDDFADGYLKWALTEGNGGKPMQVISVNTIDRQILNAISDAAASRGLMRRSLRLQPLPDPERPKAHYRFRTAGYRLAATNGKAAKRTAAETAGAVATKPAAVVAASTKTKRGRGRSQEYPHFVNWLLKTLPNHHDATAKVLRPIYRHEHPEKPLPSPKTSTTRILIHRAKAKLASDKA